MSCTDEVFGKDGVPAIPSTTEKGWTAPALICPVPGRWCYYSRTLLEPHP